MRILLLLFTICSLCGSLHAQYQQVSTNYNLDNNLPLFSSNINSSSFTRYTDTSRWGISAYYEKIYFTNYNFIDINVGTYLFNGSWNTGVQTINNESSNSIKFTTGYNRKFGTVLDIGVAFDYYNTSTREYSSVHYIDASIAMGFELAKNWKTELLWQNPFHMLSKSHDLASDVSFRLHYSISDNVMMSLILQKGQLTDMTTRLQIQYIIKNRFILFGGFQINPNSLMIGLRVNLKDIQMSLLNSTHDQLGLSTAAKLQYYE